MCVFKEPLLRMLHVTTLMKHRGAQKDQAAEPLLMAQQTSAMKI